ncbi:hypothetical protein L2E82_35146 [Cichorium intybus]|uniref:Uncharacterized protein n=1 Tax=Cichorium intybus TaxID=13427 RepID=A0ACB9BNC2_CICIN|nr:hypothetical protein L2E82_35146 [Cichorium intybus]
MSMKGTKRIGTIFSSTDTVCTLQDRKQITHDSELLTSSLAILPFILYGSLVDAPEKKPKTIVDVGCGIGGSSRYLARKYGVECHGITLSPVQAERAQALAADQGLSDKSEEHMPDKLKVTRWKRNS